MPSPCGMYAECRNIGGTPSCSCLPRYIGSPPTCRPECRVNSDCPMNLACMNEKCRDPCQGTCSITSLCTVYNHVPVCTCPERYTGDPFSNCYPAPRPSKKFKKSWKRVRDLPRIIHLFVSQLNQLSLILVHHYFVVQTRSATMVFVHVWQNIRVILM